MRAHPFVSTSNEMCSAAVSGRAGWERGELGRHGHEGRRGGKGKVGWRPWGRTWGRAEVKDDDRRIPENGGEMGKIRRQDKVGNGEREERKHVGALNNAER